jgi:hypothetical protein
MTSGYPDCWVADFLLRTSTDNDELYVLDGIAGEILLAFVLSAHIRSMVTLRIS